MRDQIFNQLCEEEADRRAQAEFMEKLRNELSLEQHEENAREVERKAQERKAREKAELLAASEHAKQVKAAKLEQERNEEDQFKTKMAAKFAEDERIEQLNAQQRRMKELEHKRQIDRIWNDKITAYKIERDQEAVQLQAKKEEQQAYQDAITEYKKQLVAQHMGLLSEYNPKAASQYGKQ
jgi:hypothetical protein